MGPSLNLRPQQQRIHLSTNNSHLPIVGTNESRASRAQNLAHEAHCVWHNEQETQAFAQALAAQGAIRNCFIELHGNLGAGKTTFVRHLLGSLGVVGRIKSPTYAVVEPHESGDLAIWHFDFYRFNDPQEWEDAGFRDIFASPGLKLAEWPNQAAGCLPQADLVMSIELMPNDQRQVHLQAHSSTGLALIQVCPNAR